ncbi:glutamate decarboxylase [Acidithiobacillus marinus]|uniref:Glutamate decarboxylase n=1 Tax=Acidithiobacillus marinus TaxID=187490 RepID=A0A2I1DQN3_9PROT|nr:glutamate decarboxylase [Acidithiobacillus marinus]PKY12186.1 glutamate decarboxylase [Acidithiobacillus marinus]
MVKRFAVDSDITPAYGSRTMDHTIPKYRLPDGEMPAQTAYQLIHDELMLDGNARLNLATFVTTWMEPEAEKLMAETFDKNMIDKDEYPQTAEIETRCVNMLSRLFNAKPEENPVGVSAIGSSEAVMLAGMAMKWRWRKDRQDKGFSTDKPNLVMGRNVQVVWEKFCRYWEIEPRYIPMKNNRYTLTPDEVLSALDENSIGVVAVLGTTFTGEFDPVKEIHDAVVGYNQQNGLQIPIHVDAASGGFVAPFLQPDLAWDFRLPNVVSINTSGHKYGLVYPGVGWALWRGEAFLPEELVFHVNYLGGDMPTFTLNFSRPGNQIVGQYYNLLRLGREGYTRIMSNLRDIASWLAGEIAQIAPLRLLSDGTAIPVFAVRLAEPQSYSVFDISERLRIRGWQVPAYTLPEDAEKVAVLRLVIREGFSRDMAELLLQDIKNTVAELEALPPANKKSDDQHFHHN